MERFPIWPTEIPQPRQPVPVALVGAGNRASTIYVPLFPHLAPWYKLVAVCDPVREHCDAVAAQFGVPAYYDLRELVRDRPMEAVIAVTPPAAKHAIGMYLCEHGIHNLTETPIATTLKQAQEVCRAATANDVVLRVAENFIRLPEYRIAAAVRDSTLIGDVKRIVSYNAHTGFHNNSVWLHFAGGRLPEWVQGITHTMTTTAFTSEPQRRHLDETYVGHFFQFPEGLMVMDHASNQKGFLGRLRRQGYAEWQGTRGTLTHGSIAYPEGDTAEVRRHSDELVRRGEAGEPLTGWADETWPVVHEYTGDHRWFRSYVDVGPEHVEYTNPFRPPVKLKCYPDRDEYQHAYYAGAMMDLSVDFALAVRGLRESEYLPEHALGAMMMEVAARESALQDGRRIPLPLKGESQADALIEQRLRREYGVDPNDVEAMLGISYPKV